MGNKLSKRLSSDFQQFGVVNTAFVLSRFLPTLGPTQSLTAINQPEPEEELLQGLDLMSNWGDDLFNGLIATSALTFLFLTRNYYHYKKEDKIAAEQFYRQQLTIVKFYGAIGAAKSLSFATAKCVFAFAAVQGISAASPWFHLVIAPVFAAVYGLMSTYLEFRAEYHIKKNNLKDTMTFPGPGQRYKSFSEYLSDRKPAVMQRLASNFLVGLGLYGSSLIPGLNVWQSMLATTTITTTAGMVPYLYNIRKTKSMLDLSDNGGIPKSQKMIVSTTDEETKKKSWRLFSSSVPS